MSRQRMTGRDLERMLRQIMPGANIDIHPDAEVHVTRVVCGDSLDRLSERGMYSGIPDGFKRMDEVAKRMKGNR